MLCDWQVTLCDPHLSALEVRFSRRCAIQIDIYVYVYSCCERVLERHSAGAIVCCGRCLHGGWWNDTVLELLWTCRVRRQCVLWQTTPSTARQRQLVINWHDVSPLNLDLIRFVTSTVYSYIYLYILPPSVRNASSLMSFRRNLKTVMFWSFFSD